MNPTAIASPVPKRRKPRAPEVSVRPIRDERDYDEAIEKLDRLMLLPRPTREEESLRDVLLVLVEAWERVHEPLELELETVTPAGMIEFYMEQHGMSRADLGRLLGDRSVASAILNGRRSPSKNHVRILAERFHAPAELFLPRR